MSEVEMYAYLGQSASLEQNSSRTDEHLEHVILTDQCSACGTLLFCVQCTCAVLQLTFSCGNATTTESAWAFVTNKWTACRTVDPSTRQCLTFKHPVGSRRDGTGIGMRSAWHPTTVQTGPAPH